MNTPDKQPVKIFFDMIDLLAIKPNSKFRSWKAMFRITFSEHKIAIFELECEPKDGDTDEAMVFLRSAQCYGNVPKNNFDKYFRGDWREYLPTGKKIRWMVKNIAGAFFVEMTCNNDEILKNKTFTLDELTNSVYKFLEKYQTERERDYIRWRNALKKTWELIDEYDSKS